MLIKISVLVVGLWGVLAAYASELRLLVPEDFDIKVVNGSVYDAPMFQRKSLQSIALSEARASQQIVVTYSQVFDDGDDFDVVKSKPFMFEFERPSDYQGDIQVLFDEPSNYKAARAFAKKPELTLVLSDKQPVAVRLSYDVEQRSWLDSFVSPEVAAADVDAMPENTLGQAVVVSKPVAGKKAVSPISKLFYWWDMASESERETFLKHVAKP